MPFSEMTKPALTREKTSVCKTDSDQTEKNNRWQECTILLPAWFKIDLGVTLKTGEEILLKGGMVLTQVSCLIQLQNRL